MLLADDEKLQQTSKSNPPKMHREFVAQGQTGGGAIAITCTHHSSTSTAHPTRWIRHPATSSFSLKKEIQVEELLFWQSWADPVHIAVGAWHA